MSAAVAMPAPRRRPRAMFAGESRRDVASRHRKSSWTGVPMIADVFRLTKEDSAIEAFLWFVYFNTEGKPHEAKKRHWKAPEYTDTLYPEDVCKGVNCFTRQHMAAKIEEACKPGVDAEGNVWRGPLVARRFETGPGRYQFKLLRDTWADMRDAPGKHDDDKVGVPRKSAKSEGLENDDSDAELYTPDEVTAKSEGEEIENSRAIGIARLIPPGKPVTLVSKQAVHVTPRTAFRNSRPDPVVIATTVAKNGQTLVDLLPLPSSHEPPDLEPLADGLKKLEYNLTPRHDASLLRKIAEGLGSAPVPQFLAFLRERLQRGRVKPAYLPGIASEFCDKWPDICDRQVVEIAGLRPMRRRDLVAYLTPLLDDENPEYRSWAEQRLGELRALSPPGSNGKEG